MISSYPAVGGRHPPAVGGRHPPAVGGRHFPRDEYKVPVLQRDGYNELASHSVWLLVQPTIGVELEKLPQCQFPTTFDVRSRHGPTLHAAPATLRLFQCPIPLDEHILDGLMLRAAQATLHRFPRHHHHEGGLPLDPWLVAVVDFYETAEGFNFKTPQNSFQKEFYPRHFFLIFWLIVT